MNIFTFVNYKECSYTIKRKHILSETKQTLTLDVLFGIISGMLKHLLKCKTFPIETFVLRRITRYLIKKWLDFTCIFYSSKEHEALQLAATYETLINLFNLYFFQLLMFWDVLNIYDPVQDNVS